jgi:sulfur transfer complex TusBCD TusB component (DsrH family)
VGQEIGEKLIEHIWALVKDFIAARNISFNVNDVMKIAEEKFISLSREEPKNKL